MTFLYGTNMELLYSLPAIGPSVATSVATVLNTVATAPPFQLPALQNIWSPSQITGKGFLVVAAGGYDISAANTLTTLKLTLDTAVGTPNISVAATGALSGSGLFGAAVTTGAWELQLWMNCVGVVSNTSSSWYAQGQLQFSSVASTGTASSFAFGNSITAGVPQAITIPMQTPFYTDLYSQWQANPTAMVCSQFMVFGLN